MKNIKIYSIDELINNDFDDEEIDIVSKSLIYSLVVGMFNYANINLSEKEIIKLSKTNNWFDKYYWNKRQCNNFKKKLDKIFYNLYRFGPIKCDNSSNEFIEKYGLKIKSKYK